MSYDDDDFVYNPDDGPSHHNHDTHLHDHVRNNLDVDDCPYCAANSAIDLDDVADHVDDAG